MCHERKVLYMEKVLTCKEPVLSWHSGNVAMNGKLALFFMELFFLEPEKHVFNSGFTWMTPTHYIKNGLEITISIH